MRLEALGVGLHMDVYGLDLRLDYEQDPEGVQEPEVDIYGELTLALGIRI